MKPVAKTVRLPGGLAERLRVVAFQRHVSQASIIVEAVRPEVRRLERELEDGGSPDVTVHDAGWAQRTGDRV